MNSLADFLRRSAALPFVWGERDCALWAVEWIRLHRDGDSAAHLRGRYKTQLGCRRLLKREGGLFAIASGIADVIGLAPVTEPQRGDVVCVDLKRFHVLGIATGNGRTAMKAPMGIIVGTPPALAAWRV